MIRALLATTDGQRLSGDERLIERWREDPGSHLWLDLQGESREAERHWLEAFGCHPMAIDDAHRDRHPPKVEEFEGHTLILYRGISAFDGRLNYAPQQMAFFLGEDFLLSLHPGQADSIERLIVHEGPGLLEASPEQVALRIMYHSAGFYLDSLLAFENELSDLEDALQEAGNDDLMKRIVAYKSRLVKMRRLFRYHAGITQELIAYDYRHLPREEPGTLHAIQNARHAPYF